MRQLFLILCLLNVAAAMWWSMQPGNGAKRMAPKREQVPSLHLLAKMRGGGQSEAKRDESCLLYGPMTSMQAEALVVAAEIDARMVETRRSQPGGYWLYLPSRGDGVNRILEELGAGGIEGFVFLGGELAGNVALGGYSSREAAGRARQRYVAMGYDVAMHEMEWEIVDYWVAVPAGLSSDAVETVAAGMELTLEKPEIVGNSCETVASGGQFP